MAASGRATAEGVEVEGGGSIQLYPVHIQPVFHLHPQPGRPRENAEILQESTAHVRYFSGIFTDRLVVSSEAFEVGGPGLFP